MSAGASPPEVFTFQLPTSRNSRNKPLESLNVTITASICLDFAHPRIFDELPERPTLVLGSAHTWERGIAETMWHQALSRIDEIGSTLLWCDGGDHGVSGVGGNAVPEGDVMQVGPGSWVRAIGLKSEPDSTQTIYARLGPWPWVILVFGAMGTEASLMASWMKLMRKGGRIRFFKGVSVNGGQVWKSLRAWERGRRQLSQDQNQDEESPLLQ